MGTTGLLDRYLGVWVYWIVGDEVVSEKRNSSLLSSLIDLSEIKLDCDKVTEIILILANWGMGRRIIYFLKSFTDIFLNYI